jgi:hypothetical protein
METFQFITSFIISFIFRLYLVGMISLVALFKLFFKVEQGDPYRTVVEK